MVGQMKRGRKEGERESEGRTDQVRGMSRWYR